MCVGSRPLWALVATAGALLAAPLAAGDGKLEIDQNCAAVGCFPGDDAGFPVQITAPGSYLLTSNLSVALAATHGIFISADHVSVDLGGFTVAGPGAGSGEGVMLNGNFIEIRNGEIRDFTDGIMRLDGEHGLRARVVGVRVSSMVSAGIVLNSHAAVHDCTITLNGTTGILVGDFSTVAGNLVSDNGESDVSHGIVAGQTSIVRDNVVQDNGGDGIRVSDSAVVTGNAVRSSGGSGIRVEGQGIVVSGNTVTLNGQHGIAVTLGNALIRANNALFNNQLALGFQNIETCINPCTLIDNHAP